MSFREYPIYCELAQDFFAKRVWVDDGPIALVGALNGTGKEVFSRLDIQKLMFIDELPYPVSASNVGALAKLVRSAVEAHDDPSAAV
jgi:hypothetical protein